MVFAASWCCVLAALVCAASGGEVGGRLWPKGVVHYMIDTKDYDVHSQDEIMSVFSALEREMCVKFFPASLPEINSPTDDSSNMVLLISNPQRRMDCPPAQYNYSGSVVEMPLGYKCLGRADIARAVVDMLRASINPGSLTSYDVLKKYEQKDSNSSGLLAADDRNYINSYYFAECGALSARAAVPASRRAGQETEDGLSPEATKYYSGKLWPLGALMYSVAPELRGSAEHAALKEAMTTIELGSCVVFQFLDLDSPDDGLAPKNLIYFAEYGAEAPLFGYTAGNQTISLQDMVWGARAHLAHALNNLMRALGVHMMSNRYDRDNYVNINWGHVTKGKQHFLEKAPQAAWLPSVSYDFNSVTHAPANYMCANCVLGAQTVQPIQDPLWSRTLSMGRATQLSQADKETLRLLYRTECQKRTS